MAVTRGFGGRSRPAAPGKGSRPSGAAPDRGGPANQEGLVSLVGAGPGDPGLITVKGLERLRAAHVVVYDRGPGITSEWPPGLPRLHGFEGRRRA